MKMEIVSTNSSYYTENKDECRVCFKSTPFTCIQHNYCQHESSICEECFIEWFSRTSQCDFCRKILFPCRQIAFLIIDEKVKIFTCKEHFLQALNRISKRDYNILKICAENFEHNLNLIEKYSFENSLIFFFQITNINFFDELTKYLKKCNLKVNTKVIFM